MDLKNISYERGNMTIKGGDVYEYDYKNRMVSATVPGAQISYLYDTSDRKIRRVKNGKAVYYFYNGNKLLCEKYSGNKLSKVYTNDDEGVLGMTRYSYDKDTDEFLLSQKLYYLFDELGSVTAITGADGMPIKYYFYDPYGEVINTTNDPGNNLTFVGRYGGYKDWDVGFINFWHRWYDSEVGKWTTRDPIGVQGGVNLYEYTDSVGKGPEINLYEYSFNNPITYIDPEGEEPWYGNYCGPGSKERDPIDKLDTACQIHDSCYKKIGLEGIIGAINPFLDVCTKKKRDECDRKLCDEAKDFKPKTRKQKIARRIIMIKFCK